MNLAVHDHRVHHVAEIIRSREAHHFDLASIGVHLNLATIGTGRIGKVGGVIKRRLLQPRFQRLKRIVVRHISRERDLAKGFGLVGAGDGELAVLEHDIAFGRFQHMGGDFLALGDDLVDRLHHSRAAHRQTARAVRAHAERNFRRIAMHDVNRRSRNAQLI